MDRNRDLAVQIVNLQKRIDEQMDLDYARHGVSIVENDYTTEITGSFYGVKADGLGTVGLKISSITIDGVAISIVTYVAPGDVLYGNITAITLHADTDANAILLHKKGHGPSAAIT